MSLIIPCFTEREIPSKMDEQIRSCSWLDGYYFPRYFGVLDFDVPLDDVKSGKAPVFDAEVGWRKIFLTRSGGFSI